MKIEYARLSKLLPVSGRGTVIRVRYRGGDPACHWLARAFRARGVYS